MQAYTAVSNRLSAVPNLTTEDDVIWRDVRRSLSRKWGVFPHAWLHDMARAQDMLDADMMYELLLERDYRNNPPVQRCADMGVSP